MLVDLGITVLALYGVYLGFALFACVAGILALAPDALDAIMVRGVKMLRPRAPNADVDRIATGVWALAYVAMVIGGMLVVGHLLLS